MADKHNFNDNKSTLQETAQHTSLPAGPHSGRGTLYDGLGEAPPRKGYPFRLHVYEREVISLVKRVGKSVI